MTSEQYLALKVKLRIHINLHALQGCTDFTDTIIAGCTPPFFHNPQVAFCLGLPDSFISSPVIRKSTLGLCNREGSFPVLPLSVFQRRFPCLFTDASVDALF